ncbi:trypco2 family protein [Streptomyces abikoensis]|uniref:trypco2 family protein n=1 Tax=Streptomyces abikoensis TaxID=97398 RepID=UPI001676FF01|nr:trypco2 family protein [Streptomyces abikoensis]GGP33021.1 hypothetical protein GCM10010214_00120 [Streptomyces abikoensis]
MEIELAAAARGSGQGITFQVGAIELEFTVEPRQDVKAKAAFRAWVVSGDGEAGMARGRTHRVKAPLPGRGGFTYGGTSW